MTAIDSVASMQARMAQITTLVSPTSAAAAQSAASSSASSAEFASTLANAVGLFSSGTTSSGAGLGTNLGSSLTAMLGGGSFLSGVTGSSQLSSLSSLFSASPVASATTSAASEPSGEDLVDAAREYLGVKYVWGGESLSEGGLDCSGLVLRSFSDIGVDGIPRVARDQGKIGTAVESMDDAKTGDLLIFDGGSHIGIYIGDGKMIDAPHRGSYVQERKVYETPTAIRRVLD